MVNRFMDMMMMMLRIGNKKKEKRCRDNMIQCNGPFSTSAVGSDGFFGCDVLYEYCSTKFSSTCAAHHRVLVQRVDSNLMGDGELVSPFVKRCHDCVS